jgi:hypothetical protein
MLMLLFKAGEGKPAKGIIKSFGSNYQSASGQRGLSDFKIKLFGDWLLGNNFAAHEAIAYYTPDYHCRQHRIAGEFYGKFVDL